MQCKAYSPRVCYDTYCYPIVIPCYPSAIKYCLPLPLIVSFMCDAFFLCGLITRALALT